jgi:hypothetical protein
MTGFVISGITLQLVCGVIGVRKGFLWRNTEEDDLLEDLAIDGKVVFQ